ncbi:MAG: hypothetical protein KKG99_06305 [Bacteroidetes bacterium]|nr:hypothetical protein [Bacteroidota bacterium]
MKKKTLEQIVLGICVMLLVACDCNFVDESNNKINAIYIGKSCNYDVYKRKIEGGTIYEYHLNDIMVSKSLEAESFRVVFVPDLTRGI